MTPFYRIIYLVYRVLQGVRLRARRRFTVPGLGLLGGCLLAGFMSPDTDNNVAYQAFTPLASLVLVSMGWSIFFRGKFKAERRLPRFATAGQPVKYRVALRNLTTKAQSGLVVMDELTHPVASFAEWMAFQVANERRNPSFRFWGKRRSPLKLNPAVTKPGRVPPARPQEEVDVELELTPLRRGVLQLASLRVARPDPLSLAQGLVKVPLPGSLIVLPRRYPLAATPLPGNSRYQQGGVAFASNVGQSDEFVSLRDYRKGDPLRHIHWRSWAKTGKPVVKEFEDEFFVRHAMVLDTFTRHDPSDMFEEAVSVAASFACTVGDQESLLDLLFVGPQSYCFTAGRGLAQTDQMLEILAGVRSCQTRPFKDLEQAVLEHVSVVSGCICILVAWDEERKEFVRKLRQLDIPLLVFVIVEDERHAKLDPGPMSDDPERFRVIPAGHAEAALAQL